MMARYIDADLLKKNCKITNGFDDNFKCVSLKTLGEVIDNQPTVDVAPVVHGEWLRHEPNPRIMEGFHEMGIGKVMSINSIYWTCSECGCWGTLSHNYCFKCGAKMDGKEKKDEV